MMILKIILIKKKNFFYILKFYYYEFSTYMNILAKVLSSQLVKNKSLFFVKKQDNLLK